MNLYIRLLIQLLKTLNKKEMLPVLGISSSKFRVLPSDLDANMHMNNGRFLTIMDIGRMDLIARIGLIKTFLNKKWYPVVGGVNIVYFKSLNPFDTYFLKTRILCWDEKWIYLEQKFEKDGIVSALAIVKATIRHGKSTVVTQEVVNQVEHDKIDHSPEFPDYIKSIYQGEKELIKSVKG